MHNHTGILFCPHPPVLVSEIGQGREQEALLTLEGLEALDAVAKGWEFDSVLLFSPHAPMFSDAVCVVGFNEYRDGLLNFGLEDTLRWKLDERLCALAAKTIAAVAPCVMMDEQTAKSYRKATVMDHGSAVPLTLLAQMHGKPIVVIAPGLLPARVLYETGRALGKAIDERGLRVAVIASGDLAHCHGDGYPYKPEGAQFDSLLREALEHGDRARVMDIDETLLKEAMQCAYPSVAMSLGMIDALEAVFKIHSYEAPFGVGYMTASASLTGKACPSLSFRERDPYVALARAAVETFVRSGDAPDWNKLKSDFPETFVVEMESKRAGAFVSLHKGGELRGCIGTISASMPALAQEIIYCACEAAGSDPRFTPVEANELLLLDVKVDILGDEEPIGSPFELDAHKYGVIVRRGARRGLLLPDLEGVDTAERQIEIAKSKAGIREDETVELSRFEVVRHKSSIEIRS